MSNCHIRPLVGSDLPAIESIWNAALRRDPTTIGRLVRNICCDPDERAGEDSGCFVATHSDRVVGFARAIIRRMPNDRAGMEPDLGWLPVMLVEPASQRRGIGSMLLQAALAYFSRHRRRRIWICGNSGSAPGYVFPGVDVDAYAGGLAFFRKFGFVVDREAVAMSREIVSFYPEAFEHGLPPAPDVRIETLSPERVQEFLEFLAREFPGDWNTAARGKIRSGGINEILIAVSNNAVVGYCQWEGEHFGPFGVSKALRSRQIGARLFIESVRRIRASDGRSVWFNWADPDAARFYQRFGLQATRRFAVLRKDCHEP